MVAQGKKLFAGEGLCLACHGPDGKGGIGPNLTDQVWLHGQGDFAEIVTRVFEGVGLEASKSGQIMPPRGGASLSDDQVRAVAAYVWTLARKPGGK
jgi:mono/diheme cytochrome c family protein